MPDAAHMPPSEPIRTAPSGLSGRTLPSGLVVLSLLYDSPEGRLYAALAPTGREVTLLVPSPEGPTASQDRPDLVGRVEHLARAERLQKVKAIHHPNIAEIYGTDTAPDGTPCLVMEPFSGEPLSAIITGRGALPLPAAIDLSLQAAAGLAAAHAAGVVHGNVSPDTMLMTRNPDGHRLKLIGFSLGPFVGGSRNEGPENARYASPEQRRGVAADEQSDVYSLAAVLHHLVSGAPPEGGGAVAESIPTRLRTVLEKALADSRTDRYPTMAALAGAIERESGPEDVPAEERGGRSRLVGLAVAIAVVVGIWLLWGWRREGMRAEAEASAALVSISSPAPATDVSQDPASFGSVDGGVSYAETERTKATPPEVGTIAPANTEPQQSRLSPFRRTHPWVAYPQGRFYYSSSCPETLEFDDLAYFATEKEAKAAGFLPARGSRCP